MVNFKWAGSGTKSLQYGLENVQKSVKSQEYWNKVWVAILFCLFVWFDSLHPINNLSVIKGRVFLGWTSTKLGLLCLAQEHNAVTSVRLEPTALWSWVKHSTTALLWQSCKLSIFSRCFGPWCNWALERHDRHVKSEEFQKRRITTLVGHWIPLLACWKFAMLFVICRFLKKKIRNHAKPGSSVVAFFLGGGGGGWGVLNSLPTSVVCW